MWFPRRGRDQQGRNVNGIPLRVRPADVRLRALCPPVGSGSGIGHRGPESPYEYEPRANRPENDRDRLREVPAQSQDMRLVPTKARRTEVEEDDELVIDLREQPPTRAAGSRREYFKHKPARWSQGPSPYSQSDTTYPESHRRWEGEDGGRGDMAYSDDDRDDYDRLTFNDHDLRQRRYDTIYEGGGYGSGAVPRGTPASSRSSGKSTSPRTEVLTPISVLTDPKAATEVPPRPYRGIS